ncbi:MAG: hypothetical protein RR672_03450 [Raoultibacter sp.]
MSNTSSRADITAGLSELLRRRLRNEGRRFAAEVRFENPACRVDFVAFKAGECGWRNIGGIEHGTTSFYEVKSCKEDYHSGNGLNFYGDENWLVMPSQVCDGLRGKITTNAGVYVPVPNGSSAITEMEHPTPYTGQVDGWSLHVRWTPNCACNTYRKYALVEILAAMIYAGVNRDA